MTLDLHGEARQVIRDFLQANPGVNTPFWSVRHIAKEYRCSKHSAYSIIRILIDLGYLEIAPKRRAIVRADIDLKLLGQSVGPLRPVFIWPKWKTEEPGNFVHEFSREIGALYKTLNHQHLSLDNPSEWGSASVVVLMKSFSANAVVAVAPPADSLILFTKLRAENLPVICIGSPRPGYDELGIITIDGDKTEAMRMLMLGLKSLGVKRPLLVGYGDNLSCHAERVLGLKAAYPEIDDVEAAGFFTNVGGAYSQVRELERRLSLADSVPDALVFNDSLCLELAVTSIPWFSERARNRRYYVAVFDDTGLSQRVDFPVVSLTLPPDKLAARTLELLQHLRDGGRVSRRTLVRRIIRWPEAYYPKQTAEE